jgi:hypothetical protein
VGRARTLSLHLRRAALGVGFATGLGAVVVAQPTAPPQAPVPAEPPVAPKAVPPGEPLSAPFVPAPEPVTPPPEAAPPPPPKAVVSEKPVETVTRRNRYDTAVLQALDKVTAETLRFEARVNSPVRWKGLVFTVRACERSAPEEPIQDSIVYLTIDSQPRPQPGRLTPPPKQAFKGWMYASSPALNPLQHATYDAWAISCRQSAPLIPAAAPRPAPKPAEPPKLDLPPATPPTVPPPAATPAPKAAEPAPKAAEPAPRPAAPAPA